MPDDSKYIIVFMTAKDKAEAEMISRGLLEKRLVACCNLVEGASSLYWWKGRIEGASETLVIAKTRRDLFGALEAEARRLHSYGTPEIIAMPIVEGSAPYLKWIDDSTG
jgi:periplasmic divalent cation tolerance protein